MGPRRAPVPTQCAGTQRVLKRLPVWRRWAQLFPARGKAATAGHQKPPECFTLVRILHLVDKLLRYLRHQGQRLFLSYRRTCVGTHVQRHRSGKDAEPDPNSVAVEGFLGQVRLLTNVRTREKLNGEPLGSIGSGL